MIALIVFVIYLFSLIIGIFLFIFIKSSKLLTELRIPNKNGKEKWSASAISYIISNVRYKGDALLQKSYTDGFPYKKVKNTGELPKFYIKDHHIAIIDREVFDAVQIELSRRSCIKKNENKNDYGKYSGKYPFNNMIVCGECGTKYRRTMWVTRDKQKEYVWRCMSRLEQGTKKCKPSPKT